MKVLHAPFYLLMFFMGIYSAQAGGPQLVITEIMYNPPENNTDTLEFIEIYNAGGTVNLLNYSIQTALVDTFPSFSLTAGSYFITCKDTAYFRAKTGVKANHQWRKDADGYSAKALSNTGETIRLYSNTGVLLDSVPYDNKTPWPNGTADGRADGGGASIVLCNFSSDNNEGANWGHCATSTGKILNGKELKISPLAAGSCLPLPVTDIRNRVAVKLYPNPVRNIMILETATNKPFELVITDVIGRVISTQFLSGNSNTIDVSGLSNGAYIIQIVEEGELIGSEKFSVSK